MLAEAETLPTHWAYTRERHRTLFKQRSAPATVTRRQRLESNNLSVRTPKRTQTSILGVQCAPDSIHHVAAKVDGRFEQAQRHPNRWYRWRTISFRNFKNNQKCSINKENPCVQSSMRERVPLARIWRWNWKDEMQHLFPQSKFYFKDRWNIEIIS